MNTRRLQKGDLVWLGYFVKNNTIIHNEEDVLCVVLETRKFQTSIETEIYDVKICCLDNLNQQWVSSNRLMDFNDV